jgi:hypothetical protein
VKIDGMVVEEQRLLMVMYLYMEKYQRLPYNGTLGEAGREEYQKIAGEDRLPKKPGEAGMNQGFW